MKLNINRSKNTSSYSKEEELKEKAANFLAKKLTDSAPDSFKRDTKSTKFAHNVADVIRDNARKASKYVPDVN